MVLIVTSHQTHSRNFGKASLGERLIWLILALFTMTFPTWFSSLTGQNDKWVEWVCVSVGVGGCFYEQMKLNN